MSNFIGNNKFICIYLFVLVVTQIKLVLKMKAKPLKSRCIVQLEEAGCIYLWYIR